MVQTASSQQADIEAKKEIVRKTRQHLVEPGTGFQLAKTNATLPLVIALVLSTSHLLDPQADELQALVSTEDDGGDGRPLLNQCKNI